MERLFLLSPHPAPPQCADVVSPCTLVWACVSWAKFKIQSTVAATAGTFVCHRLNYFLFRKFYGFQFVFKWNPVESELVSQWMEIRDNQFPTVSAPLLSLWPGHCTMSI